MTGVLFPGSNIAGKYTTLDPGPLTITVLRYFITQLFLSGLLHYKSSAPIPCGATSFRPCCPDCSGSWHTPARRVDLYRAA
jgi:hypothetical protein